MPSGADTIIVTKGPHWTQLVTSLVNLAVKLNQIFSIETDKNRILLNTKSVLIKIHFYARRNDGVDV